MLGKNRRKKVRKTFFIFTQISLQNMGGKTRETIFQKHKNSANKKCWGKIFGKKCEKLFFYIYANIVTKKWGEQNARNNFSRNTLTVRAKNVGNRIVGKKCEKRFLYSHKYRYQKMGGEIARNNFSRKIRILRAKNVWKKIVGKK